RRVQRLQSRDLLLVGGGDLGGERSRRGRGAENALTGHHVSVVAGPADEVSLADKRRARGRTGPGGLGWRAASATARQEQDGQRPQHLHGHDELAHLLHTSGWLRVVLRSFYHAVATAAARSNPSSSIACSRILNFCTFPVTVIGKPSTNFTYR